MKKNLLSGILVNLILATGYGQTYDWVNALGASSYDDVQEIHIAGNGDVYCAGNFNGTVDFDPGAGTTNLSGSYYPAFLSKYNSQGDLIWAKSFSASGAVVELHAMTVDPVLGYIYITGRFAGATDFDPNAGSTILTPVGLADVFICKYNSDGMLLWAKQFEGSPTFSSTGMGITTESSGNVMITGQYTSTVDFNPGVAVNAHTSNGQNDIFIVKLNYSGDYLWSKSIGGSTQDGGYTVAADASDNVYIGGFFEAAMDADPGLGVTTLTSTGYGDAFIAKLNNTGDFVWAYNFGGSNPISNDHCNDITLDGAGNVYATGDFFNTADFDTDGGATVNLTSAGVTDAFVLKWDNNAGFIWAKQLGGFSSDVGTDISLDADYNVYTTGYFNATADFDPGVATSSFVSGGSDNAYISKLNNTDGSFVWAAQLSGNQSQGLSIDVDDDNNVYSAGYYISTCDFDPASATTASISSNGQTDMYIHKLAQCQVELGVTISGVTLSASQSGATYQWIDCNTFAPVSGATSQNFTPASDGDYACKITYGVCIDTTICYTVSGVGLSENNAFQFGLYPNPVNTNLTIQTNETISAVFIYNAAGTLIQSENKNTFSVENLPAGIYFLQIQTENGIGTTRFVKE